MKWFTSVSAAILLLASANIASAGLIRRAPPNVPVNANAFWIEFESEPGTPAAALEHKKFLDTIEGLDGINIRQDFNDIINALSVDVVDPDLLPIIAEMEGVRVVSPVHLRKGPTILAANGDKIYPNHAPHNMTGVREVHSKLGYRGSGVKIGIIDTGIDYKHPALGGCFGKGCRVFTGWDFVGDTLPSGSIPDADPRDTCGGHGTHVAGIIGANDKDFIGVAPDVSFGAYRVLGCDGRGEEDIIVAAMLRAYKDGMDIINMSLGGPSGWSETQEAVVASRLVQKGVIVIAAMGNEGEIGIFEAGAPSTGENVLSVASFDNLEFLSGYATISAAPDRKLFFGLSGEKKLPFNSAGIAAVSDDSTVENDACEEIKKDVKGKIALIRRGGCTFNVKAQNVQKKGAIMALIYNNQPGEITPTVDDDIKIPTAGLSDENGLFILAQLKKNAKTELVFHEPEIFPSPTGGTVSDFSSYGLDAELHIKPDIAAPGGNIYSTFPLDLGSYKQLSGTSMASPYVAGSVALYLNSRKNPLKHDALPIYQLFQNTAIPANEFEEKELSSVARQGAGLINVYAALTTTTTVAPRKIALNDTANFQSKQSITLHNLGKTAQIYTLSNIPTLGLAPFNLTTLTPLLTPAFVGAYAKVDMPTKITVLPNQKKRVTLHFTPPKASNAIYSGYITVTPASGPVIRVPYAGMSSPLRNLPILDPTSPPFLMLTRDNTTVEETTSVTFTQQDSLILGITLSTAAKHVTASVLDQANKILGLIPGGNGEYLPRSDSQEGNEVLLLPWQGNLAGKTEKDTKVLPNGTYRVRVRALKSFGIETKAGDWEEWESPNIVIKRK